MHLVKIFFNYFYVTKTERAFQLKPLVQGVCLLYKLQGIIITALGFRCLKALIQKWCLLSEL
jgi:hypothetical protein